MNDRLRRGVELYREGVGLEDAAASVGTTFRTLRRAVVAAGVAVRPAVRPLREVPADLGQVVDREIADREGVTPHTVYRWRVVRGVPACGRRGA